MLSVIGSVKVLVPFFVFYPLAVYEKRRQPHLFAKNGDKDNASWAIGIVRNVGTKTETGIAFLKRSGGVF